MDEKEILSSFADNMVLFDAVRRVVLSEFKHDKIDVGMTNEMLGQKTRSRLEGTAKVDAAFKKIQAFKTLPDKKQGENPAR